MESNPKAPIVSNPQLADKVFAYIQLGLVNSFPWLDKAFGRAQKLVKKVGKGKYFYPSVYTGATAVSKNEYIGVSPDSKIGNFSFFVLEDPQDIDWIKGQSNIYIARFSLIFWFNIEKTPALQRNTEELKTKILQALNQDIWIKQGSIRIKRVFEQSENIYRGFSLDEIDNQFLMHPYGGFRFEGELKITENC